MNRRLTIPVYVDHHRDEEGRARHRARPLFLPGWDRDELDEREDRALKRLTDRIRRQLVEEAAAIDHRTTLLPWSYCPTASGHAARLRLELRRRTYEGLFYAAAFEGAGRRLAIMPRGAGLTFEWPAGARLEEVMRNVLTEHFRRMEKDGEEDFDPSRWSSGSQPHLTHVTVVLTGNQQAPAPATRFLSLAQEQPMDGGRELNKVGRCLDRLHPQDLHRALMRENEVEELRSWFGRKTAHVPMVLLVGRPGSGKTALIHECVRRGIESPMGGRRGQYWLVSPQRVISGMSYVGQWEERWTAMLGEMRKRRHILVLDDLPGLFSAGRTSASDLTLGHVLKARQEHEPVAVLAETTPEAWGRLRELDRAFASMFHVIHVRETTEEVTLRLMVRTLQALEAQSTVRFAPEVLPLIMRLQQRFGRGRAFPGKGVEMLTALSLSLGGGAQAERETAVEPEEVLQWFAARHGIRLSMLDAARPLTSAALRSFFAGRIMGQQEAVDAMTDTVLMARAEVHDARRPMGTLLFLGPTGVGKTECARALAEFVFGSEEKMLRFDLNEYTGGDAALRLIGGPGRSGLLTSRVRRQPFSLLLFDEVEKAHPDVFDLLLQVLGEGRLTDAQGGTADFCNCLVILTSNLGARDARRRLGFDDTRVEDQEAYLEAARKFFRPEFFNRLDRLVPFHELRREDIARLARTMAARALERQGLQDRQVEVDLDEAAVSFLAARGFDQEYGARALRRAIETHFVEPLAASLLSLDHQKAVQARATLGTRGEIEFAFRAQTQAALHCIIPPWRTDEMLLDDIDGAHAALDRAADKLETWTFEETDGTVSELRAWYFRLRDEYSHLRKQLERVEDALEAEAKARRRAAASRASHPLPPRRRDALRVLPPEIVATLLDHLLANRLAPHAVSAVLDRAQALDELSVRVMRLLWRARHLDFLCDQGFAKPGKWTLRALGTSATAAREEWLPPRWIRHGFAETEWSGTDPACLLMGHGAAPLVAASTGACAVIADSRMALVTLTASGPEDAAPAPDESIIVRLRLGEALVDLRTGLLFRDWREESGELAFALCYHLPDEP